MSGYIKVNRELWDHPAFREGPMSQREAFIWMIADASWKARTVRRGDVVIELQRGQLAHSIRYLAEAFQWSKSTVQRFIKALEKRDMVRSESGTGVTLITICNYDKYQGGEQGCGTAAGQARDEGGTNYKKGIQDKKDNISPTGENTRKRATRLPEDWTPPEEWIDEAVSRGFTRAEAYDHAEQMRDWSRSAKAGAKLDWRAAWRNWVKRKLQEREARPADRQQSNTDRRRSAWLDVVDEIEREGAGRTALEPGGAGSVAYLPRARSSDA